MKKIYVTLFAGLFFSQLANAQLTLTKVFNEPVTGNVNSRKGYDSLSTSGIPKSSGASQSWNFSAFTANTSTSSSTFTTPAAVPSSSAYAGVTLVEDQGGGSYNFYKSISTPTTQFELLGSYSSTLSFNYNSSSAIAAIWPVAFGYSVTDTYSGTVSGLYGGTLSGTVTTLGSGNGNLTIPGGTNFTNILQVRTVNIVTLNITSPVSTTLAVLGIDYDYYHASQKFPLMTVSYQNSGAGYTEKTWLNTALITGLNDKNFDATFAIFPNPAKETFNVKLTNNNNENGTVSIYNSVGQLVKTVNLGNSTALETTIMISDLPSGIYVVKTTLGNKSSARRLIVE